MFEAGKYYKPKNGGSRRVKILYVGKQYCFVQEVANEKCEEMFPHKWFETWEEYTPPVTHVQELYLKHNVHGGFMLRDDASNFTETPGTRTLGKIRLTWTEGETPEAEIL